MDRKPLVSLWEARKRYGYEPAKRPQLVDDDICQWCGNPITGKRRKSFCCKECSDEFHRRVTWGRTRNAYSNNIVWRDNLTCQDCGTFLAVKNCHGIYIPLEKGAEVHHIKPVQCGGDDNPNNLITLCHSCHQERHKALRAERNG